jgi:hypothetical protein
MIWYAYSVIRFDFDILPVSVLRIMCFQRNNFASRLCEAEYRKAFTAESHQVVDQSRENGTADDHWIVPALYLSSFAIWIVIWWYERDNHNVEVEDYVYSGQENSSWCGTKVALVVFRPFSSSRFSCRVRYGFFPNIREPDRDEYYVS